MSATNSRVEALAAELESVNVQVVAACEGCSDADWKAAVWDDGRPAGAVYNHIADAYDAVTRWGVMIANGEEPPQLTMEQIHQFNERSATEVTSLPKQEILTLLQEKAKAAAALIRGLEDGQLDIVGTIPFMGGDTTAERLIKGACINHARGHLKAILGPE